MALALIATARPMSGQELSGKSNSLRITLKNQEAQKKEVKPTIQWVNPKDPQQVLDDVHNLFKLGVNSQSPLVKVTFILNDEVINTYEEFDSIAGSGYLFDAWIEQPIELLPGINNITLIVQNELGALQHKRKLEVRVKPVASKDYALIVGIEEYNNWDQLDGPVRDAERIARDLEARNFEISLLRDATTFDILDKFEELARKNYGPHDQLLVYLAGHGFYDEKEGRGYLVCKNSVKEDQANVTYLSYDVIKNIVNNIPVPHVLLVVDAVKGKGESLPLAGNHDAAQTYSGLHNLTPTTRIGVLSGMADYHLNNAYAEGSPLSQALTNYFSKDLDGPLGWNELSVELEKLFPKPIYIEFGDHRPGTGFTLRPSDY